jgi:15-cis-phytoene synthase
MRLSPPDPILAEARDTTRRVARTFSLACRMLPRDLRDDVYRLYLVFRTLDDLVDFGDPRADDRLAAVEEWCAGAAPRSRESLLLADLDTRYGLPRDALIDFCRGMREDLAGTPIETESELDRYCYRVAGTVGVTMAALLGTDDLDAARPSAAALGMAMQRTNILRDIDEDLANGRIYLARETIDRYGSFAPGERATLMRDQIRRADALYDEGVAGIRRLHRGRRAIRAAGQMYREILRQIEREGYGKRAGRVVVPRSRKMFVAVRAAGM